MYYSPQNKFYTLTQDKLTDSVEIKAQSPFETLPGSMMMEYKAGEKWGVKCLANLSDRRASYPELVMRWTWSDKPIGTLLLVIETQVIAGEQSNPDLITVRTETPAGKEVSVKSQTKSWKHLDPENTKVGVLVFVVVDPVEGETDAGVILRVMDATSFTGYRTQFWTASLIIQEVTTKDLESVKVAALMEDAARLVEMGAELEIGLPVSRINSLDSLQDFPDMATLHDLTY